MIAVIFEVSPAGDQRSTYLDLAGQLHHRLADIDGFLSIERFESLSCPGKLLSLSFWRDEQAIMAWRNSPEHRAAQHAGRNGVFADYRLRIAGVVRDYGMTERDGAPPDSRNFHGVNLSEKDGPPCRSEEVSRRRATRKMSAGVKGRRPSENLNGGFLDLGLEHRV